MVETHRTRPAAPCSLLAAGLTRAARRQGLENGLRERQGRIVVTRLDDNDDGTAGPAEKAGLQIGDELLEVNGEEMRSLPQAQASLRAASAADGGPEACAELRFRRAPAPARSRAWWCCGGPQ